MKKRIRSINIKQNMIGTLPKELVIDGKSYRIRTDYRAILTVFEAINDPDLSDMAKSYILLDALYIDKFPITSEKEAMEQAVWFIDGGKKFEDNKKKKAPKLMDWQQDEQLIFSSINAVAGKEIRELDYVHWWTFLGYFNEIREGLFSTIVSIRKKKAEHKKLEKYEKEFYQKNRDLIDIKKSYSSDQKKEMDELNALLNG